MQYTVSPAEDGRRLRDVLRQGMQLSYTAMKSAKWEQRIHVNGSPRTVDQPVHTGDIITILPPHSAPMYTPSAFNLALDVPYEDDHLLVINKPAPLASQSSARQADNTLENALYARSGCPESFVYRPVNRLDKGTSGLMVVSKDAHTQHLLQRMLHTPQFIRRYLAVVEGSLLPAHGIIDAPITKEDAASIRRIVCESGKPSVTHYDTLLTSGNRSLVRLQLETGRTHQIRVHMSHLGCPVAGDFLYGTELPELPGRFALHSAELIFTHPISGATITLTAPLPPALSALLES